MRKPMNATGQCKKCGKRFTYSSQTIEKAAEFVRNRINTHHYYDHPTLWQRVKAWWRR